VCPSSQFVTVVVSKPIRSATSRCLSPESKRRFRRWSPTRSRTVGYAELAGFWAFRRAWQKGNAGMRVGNGHQHEARMHLRTVSTRRLIAVHEGASLTRCRVRAKVGGTEDHGMTGSPS